MNKISLLKCAVSVLSALPWSQAQAKIRATDAGSGGVLLIFATEESEGEDGSSDLVSAVYCPISTKPNKEATGCVGESQKIFNGLSVDKLQNLMAMLLPELETHLIESDIKIHVQSLNLWSKSNKFMVLDQKRRGLEDKIARLNLSLDELKASGLSVDKIRETRLFKQADECSEELRGIRNQMLPIEPSREAINHEFDRIINAALDSEVHSMVAVSPNENLVEVVLSIFSEREGIENMASNWSGFVIDLQRVDLLKGHHYVISSAPGSETVSFFKCLPEEDTSGCLKPNETPRIRLNKESFLRSAEVTLPIHGIISQASWQNQYMANVNPDETLELLKIINRSTDRDKDWEGVDLVTGIRWWRAYADCSRLRASEMSEKYPDWNLPEPKDLSSSLDFLIHSGWISQDSKTLTRLWIKAEPTLGVGRVRDRYSRARETDSEINFGDSSMTIPWQMYSPYAELSSEIKLSGFSTEVNSTSTTQKDYVWEGAKLRRKISSSNWRTFSPQNATASAWLWNEY